MMNKRDVTAVISFFVAQDRQANGCLHTNSFAGRKNMEHEMRNVRVRNRVGVSLLDFKKTLVDVISCIVYIGINTENVFQKERL